jgi:3-deoxy-D-manno-octulosonic-acid transferase
VNAGVSFLYNLLLLPLLLTAAVPVLLLRRWREGVGERLGFREGPVARQGTERYWVHGASVGEVLAAEGLMRALLERHPAAQVVFSTFTVSGRSMAREKLAAYRDRVTVTLAPLDWDGLPGRVTARFDPSLFLILETELWPNLINALGRIRCPLVLVNGRLSGRSFPRYRLMRWFFRPLLQKFSLICARTSTDAERFRQLGAVNGRVRVTGNIKYDFGSTGDLPAWASLWPGRTGGGPQRIVAGSLRGSEPAAILDCFARLRERFSGLQLLLAPRYPDRFDTGILDARGLSWARWSAVRDAGAGKETSVVFIDTMGDLAALYSAADAAFVGGTLEGTEGQNLLEPAVHSVPVLFGPGYDSFREEGQELLAAGGGFVTPDTEALTTAFGRLLESPGECDAAGRRAREVADRFGGATARTLALIDELRGKEIP